MQQEAVLLRELHDAARHRQVGVGAEEVELADRHVCVLAQQVFYVAHDGVVFRPRADVASRPVRTQRRQDQVGRFREQLLRALVVGARDERTLQPRLAQDRDGFLGRRREHRVVAVVDVGVEDRQLVGEGDTGHGEQQDEHKEFPHGAHCTRPS